MEISRTRFQPINSVEIEVLLKLGFNSLGSIAVTKPYLNSLLQSHWQIAKLNDASLIYDRSHEAISSLHRVGPPRLAFSCRLAVAEQLD